jgi:hypothetical protein
LAAAATSSAYAFCFPSGPNTTPFFVCSRPAETPHSAAAATTSIARAVAPALRNGSHNSRMLRLPPVRCCPYDSSSGACRMRTLAQSASSSSATSIGNDVRTPCPISERVTHTVTTPLAPISTNALGASTASSPRASMRRSNPAPAAAVVIRNARRDRSVIARSGLRRHDESLAGSARMFRSGR